MLKSITGAIESASILRTGISPKNNRPWTMFSVIINGEKFSTFDSNYQKNIGKSGTWEYEEKPSADGQYINRTLSRYPEIKGSEGLLDDKMIRALGLIRGEIAGLRKELQEVKELINAISVEATEDTIEESVNMPNSGINSGIIRQEDIPVIEEGN